MTSKPPTPQFTRDGSPYLEAHLRGVCDQVRSGVERLVPRDRLAGILLAGGYGRGEGGVLHTPDGDRPYNDMEFYVFVRGIAAFAERRYREALHQLGETLSPGAGLEVEFKVLTPRKLCRAAPSMFYYDLIMGHRVVGGNAGFLAGCEHHRDATRIPLHEATRLLMNRCSGLLFAKERLERTAFDQDEADFVGRNLAKVQLALGDVLLAALGQYHWSCRERHARLLRLAQADPSVDLAALREHHAAGVEFKLHPVRSGETRDALGRRWRELCGLARRLWLWLEGRRLQVAFASPAEYARWPGQLCPESLPWRNRLVNLRHLGWRCAVASDGGRYPRERLLRSLALLLWDTVDGNPEWTPETLKRVSDCLMTPAVNLPGLVAAYGRLWQRFN